MTIHELLTACTQAGVSLKWDGSNIKAYGERQAVSRLLPILRPHKTELHAYFEVDMRELYEERAAILEYDGGLSRTEAERLANDFVKNFRGQQHGWVW